ncbi:MAG TPA: hypothetical protein VME17_22595 [Bryobacteraceae bacterium]|nr:hypothetical protein [Bryobacteraceae bacterium]
MSSLPIDRLEAAKRAFGMPEHARLAQLLRQASRVRFHDAEALIRYHEALLFFRAYPPNAEVLRLADELLAAIPKKIEQLRQAGADLTPLEEPEVSGIAGTAFSALFTYDITRWLAEYHAKAVEIDWDGYDESLLAPLLRRLHPFANEDLLVEANIPYLEWFGAGKPRGAGSDLRWLVSKIDNPELFAQAKIATRWKLDALRATRTNGRLPGRRQPFFHDAPLIRRADISLARELASPKLPVQKLTRKEGETLLDFARETSAMRYRELHGFTYGDPARVLRCDIGRGVEVFVCGVPPEHRLPLRAYHAGMFFKNSVPIGYIETLTLFEHMEVGFNLYYTFREGETGWLYARLMRLFQQLLGATCFAVDPYQIGRHNEEAIESGAFWFYRKLGFRPANAGVAELLELEEAKIRKDPSHRTSARTLERLAAGWMIYETPGAHPGDWDHFETRRAAMALHECPFPPEIERAKNAPDESTYVRALQRDRALRRRMLKLGSALG